MYIFITILLRAQHNLHIIFSSVVYIIITRFASHSSLFLCGFFDYLYSNTVSVLAPSFATYCSPVLSIAINLSRPIDVTHELDRSTFPIFSPHAWSRPSCLLSCLDVLSHTVVYNPS